MQTEGLRPIDGHDYRAARLADAHRAAHLHLSAALLHGASPPVEHRARVVRHLTAAERDALASAVGQTQAEHTAAEAVDAPARPPRLAPPTETVPPYFGELAR